MPARPVLLGLLLLAVAPPFVARASGTLLGAFGMFTRIDRYHLELSVFTASGVEPVKVSSLGPHISRDARGIILPAGGYGFGADQLELVAGGLEDIGRLICALRPDAVSSHVALYRGAMNETEMRLEQSQVLCSTAR